MWGGCAHALVHRVANERSGVAATDEDPRRLPRRDAIAIGLGKLDVLREVVEVVDRLLNSVHLERLDREVVVGVGLPEESVFQDDG